MSVTFHSNKSFGTRVVREACLCSQMCEGWPNASPEALRAEADPNCPQCKGEGIETVVHSDEPYLNWANENAKVVLLALGLGTKLYGAISIPEARRAIMRGKACYERYMRPETAIYGKPRTEEGVTVLRPLRCYDPGLPSEGILERIEAFENFVETVAAAGATRITWM